MQVRLFNSHNYHHDFRYGFLPKEMPLTQLPESSLLNQRINQIAKDLPRLLANNQLRKVVDELNAEFPNEKLTLNISDKREQNVAFLFLTVITQAYIWQDKTNPTLKVPAILGNTLDLLCRIQKRFPTMLYSDYALNNFKWNGPCMDNISLNNIDPIITFTASKDEAWFIKVHIVIEAVCAKAIFAAFQMCTRMDLDEKTLCELLNIISSSMKESVPILQQMKNGCDPTYFFHTLRPHYNAWNLVKNQEQTGVKLEGFEWLGQLMFSYRGVSGAQSTILPALDAALGIQHEQNVMSNLLREFRNYMPQSHRHLIALLEQNNIRQKIVSSKSEDLKKAWEAAIDGVASFRAMHMGYISRYIAKPSGESVENIVGTSGTTIPEFLGARYVSTRAAKL